MLELLHMALCPDVASAAVGVSQKLQRMFIITTMESAPTEVERNVRAIKHLVPIAARTAAEEVRVPVMYTSNG